MIVRPHSCTPRKMRSLNDTTPLRSKTTTFSEGTRSSCCSRTSAHAPPILLNARDKQVACENLPRSRKTDRGDAWGGGSPSRRTRSCAGGRVPCYMHRQAETHRSMTKRSSFIVTQRRFACRVCQNLRQTSRKRSPRFLLEPTGGFASLFERRPANTSVTPGEKQKAACAFTAPPTHSTQMPKAKIGRPAVAEPLLIFIITCQPR